MICHYHCHINVHYLILLSNIITYHFILECLSFPIAIRSSLHVRWMQNNIIKCIDKIHYGIMHFHAMRRNNENLYSKCTAQCRKCKTATFSHIQNRFFLAVYTIVFVVMCVTSVPVEYAKMHCIRIRRVHYIDMAI